MAARKKAARKRPARKKAARKKATRKSPAKRATAAMRKIEGDLPPNLAQFSRQMRGHITKLEKQILTARADARKRGTRLLRDASHMLGRYEAEGAARWNKATTKARREAASVLRRLEKAVAPPRPRKKAAR